MDTICRRDIKLSDYNISRAKYNELKYFCIQYAEKKQKLQNAYGLKATVNDGMPKSNLSGDSTAQEAVRNAMMQKISNSLRKPPEKPLLRFTSGF